MMDLIRNAIANLKGHKLRVFVTIFWIVVGVSAVIIIGSLGNGAKKEFEGVALKEANSQVFLKFYPNEVNLYGLEEKLLPITRGDVMQLQDIPYVKKVEAERLVSGDPYGDLRYRGKSYFSGLHLLSFNEEDPYIKDAPIEHGRHLTKADENTNRIVLNNNAAYELGSDELQELIGQGVEFGGKVFEVVGIMKPVHPVDKRGNYYYTPLQESSIVMKSYMEQDNAGLDPNEPAGLTVTIHLEEGGDPKKVEDQAIALLNTNHPGIQGFYALNTDMMPDTSEMQEIVQMLNLGVYGVILAFMFISGLGVMNIMYVSVVERKREIGIRRAIGASPGKIIFQFLVESSVITMTGCAIGIVIGSILLVVLKPFLPFPAIPTVLVYFQSIISSLLTGILFGFIPARRAAKIDPIEAIRG